jgi:hypothetical protein
MTHGGAIQARWQGACLARYFDGCMAIRKRTTEEHQITHGSTPALEYEQSSRIVSEYPLKAGLPSPGSATSFID